MSWFDIDPKNFRPLKFSQQPSISNKILMPFARSQAYFAGEEI